jgi:hypothetical protein
MLRARILQRKLKKQQKRQQRINHRTLKVFSDCDFLPAWRFFKVFETDDKRYIVDCDTIPEYDQNRLVKIWDDLIKQYDKISGENVFENSFLDINSDLEEWNELVVLKAHYGLIRIGRAERLKDLEEFGIKADKITYDLAMKVRSEILKRETRLEIDSMSMNDTSKYRPSFIQSIVQLSNLLSRSIDYKTVTVSEYIYLNKEAKEIVKARQPKKELWER